MRINGVYFLIIFFKLVFLEVITAQNQGNNWYFSKNAGINFNTIPPSPINFSAINTADNSSSISDANGQILFYTDGITVYNRQNQIMPNGINLAGNQSGGQATLIIPIPKSNKYVVFSIPDIGNKPLYYSIVNMELDNQKGDVELKNQKLFNNSTEKIAGIYNCSEDFYWVITHQYETNLFYVYKIDKNGLNPIPIISSVGLIHTGGPINDVNNSAGQLSLSKDGKHIASALYYSGEVELFDFSLSTGIISNPKLIPNYTRAWGVEFSEDGTKLYLSQWTQTQITQFDLSIYNINNIINSATKVGDCIGTDGYYSGYLQRGPNNKIYIAQWEVGFLSYIDKPNELGLLCNFILNGHTLNFGLSKAGLCRVVFPELTSSSMKFLGSDTLICDGTNIILKSISDSTHWSDGSIGNQIIVNKGGVYWAEIITPCGIIRDTQIVSVSKCSNLCDIQCHNFEWMNWTISSNNVLIGKSTKGLIKLNKDPNAGTFYPSLSNYQLNSSNYLPKNINSMPTFWMPGNPNITKLTHNIYLDSLKERKELLILLGEFPNSILYSKPQIGKLRVFDRSNKLLDVSNICTVFRDQIPPHDSILLFYGNNELLLDVNGAGIADGGIIVLSNFPDSAYIIQIEHNNEISSKDDGIYINVGLTNCCFNIISNIDTIVCGKIIINGKTIINSGIYSDTIKTSSCDSVINYSITVLDKPQLQLGKDTIICEGNSIRLKTNSTSTIWSNGTIGTEIIIDKAGIYWAELSNICGTIRDSIILALQKVPTLDLGPDIQICPNTIDTIWSTDSNTKWQDGSVSNYFLIMKPGKILATITNQCGEAKDSILVSYIPNSNIDFGPDTILCEGSILTLNSGSSNTVWFDNTIGNIKQITKGGTYWATISSSCGNVSDSISILEKKVFAKPYLPNDTFLCQGINLTYSLPIIDEIWNNQFLNMISIHREGKYWYEFKDYCNQLADTFEVFYDSFPSKFPSHNYIFCGPDPYRFSTGNQNTQWSDGTVGPEISISKSGLYYYTVSNTCGIFKDSIQLEFIEEGNLYLPNIFSPNGDQVNDFFPGTQFTSDFEIEIFDRWGSLVFSSNNIHWDGTFKNQNVPPGVYTYIIKSKSCSNTIKYGNVTVVR